MTSVVVIRLSLAVRASRLVGLLGLLQARGRMTTRQLASELEVSQRTILRDIEALSAAGIPVYAVRGRQGGFELLDGFTQRSARRRVHRQPRPAADAQVLRARVRLSPRGRRLAALLGRPAGIRVRRTAARSPGARTGSRPGCGIDSADAAVLELLALGAEVEVLHPPQLRAQVGQTARLIAELHSGEGTTPGAG